MKQRIVVIVRSGRDLSLTGMISGSEIVKHARYQTTRKDAKDKLDQLFLKRGGN